MTAQVLEVNHVGTVNVELSVQPTSVNNPALNVKGQLLCDSTTEVDISFRGWTISSSRFSKKPESAQIVGGNLKILTERNGIKTEFNLVLAFTPEESKELQVSRGRDYIWRIIGNFYPFIARKLRIPITIKSSGNKINANVNLVFGNNMIPYGGNRVGFDRQSTLKVGESRMLSGTVSGENKASKYFSVVMRFSPFFAFQQALSPLVLIYTAALVTQVLQKITSLSMHWEFFDISVEPTIALRILQMAVNVYLFVKISKIKIDIIGTRCLLTAFKVWAWAFMGMLIVNATYPGLLAIFGFNIFDFMLKAAQILIIGVIPISLVIYPYIVDEAKRTHAISIIIIIAAISSIWYAIAAPPLSTASDLLDAR